MQTQTETMTTEQKTALREFVRGFAKGADILCMEEADSHWAAFSQFLTDKQRLAIEAGGKKSGEEHGRQYVTLFKG